MFNVYKYKCMQIKINIEDTRENKVWKYTRYVIIYHQFEKKNECLIINCWKIDLEKI